jgi:hypothetical protein
LYGFVIAPAVLSGQVRDRFGRKSEDLDRNESQEMEKEKPSLSLQPEIIFL